MSPTASLVMPLSMPLLSALMETSLNALLSDDPQQNAVFQRLNGRVLAIELRELPSPLVLLFHRQQIDIVTQWSGEVDCTITTGLRVLPQLRHRQQLMQLMRSDALSVEGDLQVIQQFVMLLELSERDPAEWLAPYLGDIVAEGLMRTVQKRIESIKKQFSRQQNALENVIKEQWQLAPGGLEVADFNSHVDQLTEKINEIARRIDRMEKQS